MNEQKKKIIYFSLIAMTVLLFGLVVYWQLSSGKKTAPAPVPVSEPDRKMTASDAYGLALVKAREWDPAAVLSKINSAPDKTSAQGRADSWELLYTSENKKGLAYIVTIADKNVADGAEIPFFGAGGELPQNLLSSEEAIAKVRQIGGYENEPILSVEMIYDEGAKLWFWGVKTARGTVSVKATK